MNIYKLTRIILYPIIFVADFFQTNCAALFTPMNIGPVTTKNWSKIINKLYI